MPDRVDVLIVGGGIVGLATAARDRARPSWRADHDPREGVAHRTPPDRSKLGCPALRHLLPTRVAEGRDVRVGPARDGAVLHRARCALRTVREGHRRGGRARATPPRTTRSARLRERRQRGEGRTRATARARAACRGDRRLARPRHRHRRLLTRGTCARPRSHGPRRRDSPQPSRARGGRTRSGHHG